MIVLTSMMKKYKNISMIYRDIYLNETFGIKILVIHKIFFKI